MAWHRYACLAWDFSLCVEGLWYLSDAQWTADGLKAPQGICLDGSACQYPDKLGIHPQQACDHTVHGQADLHMRPAGLISSMLHGSSGIWWGNKFEQS